MNPAAFIVRPVYGGSELLIEFLGDHRATAFPPVVRLLRDALGATPEPHTPLEVDWALRLDRVVSTWCYRHGRYEIDDDVWALFVAAPDNNAQVIADVSAALLASGRFVQHPADFSKYA